MRKMHGETLKHHFEFDFSTDIKFPGRKPEILDELTKTFGQRQLN
jgi:hypothetical protein